MLNTNKNIEIVRSHDLYKWAKNYKRLQNRFYGNQYKLRRLQQIEDFVFLNNYTKVFHDEEVHLDLNIPTVATVEEADLILVTHQGYSRFPMPGIVEQCRTWLNHADLYLCLNSTYMNIDNQKIDISLDEDFLKSITIYLKTMLDDCVVVDMSRYLKEDGEYFTWSCPDRHYFITKAKR
jgi:hypothetical protein